MTTATLRSLDFGTASMHANLPVPRLVELALARGEGVLASNGALACATPATAPAAAPTTSSSRTPPASTATSTGAR